MAVRKSPHPERARSAQSKGAGCMSQRTFQFFHTLESGGPCSAPLSLDKPELFTRSFAATTRVGRHP
jgi:hypothetical protein